MGGHFGSNQCPWQPLNPDAWPEMPDWCTYISLECHLAHKMLGFRQHTDYQMAFSIADRMLVELAFARYPNLKHITELGTSAGVSTLYLSLMARTRGGTLLSFDWQDRFRQVPEVVTGWLDNAVWTEANILIPGGEPNVIAGIKRANNFVWFDNGNKVQEINTYLKYMTHDSIMFTHDWGDEITVDQFQHTLDQLGWVMLFQEYSEFIESGVRVFAHKSNVKPKVPRIEPRASDTTDSKTIAKSTTSSSKRPGSVHINGRPRSGLASDTHKEGLIITRATYGLPGRMKKKLLSAGDARARAVVSIKGEDLYDMTECLQAMVVVGKTQDELVFAGKHDQLCDHDPFPQQAKELTVEYRNHLGDHVLHLLDGHTGRIFGKHEARTTQELRAASTNTGKPLCRRFELKYGGADPQTAEVAPTCPWIPLQAETWTRQPNFCDLFHGQCRAAHHLLGHTEVAPFTSPAFSVSDRIILEQTWALFENLKKIVYVGAVSMPTLYMGMMANTRAGNLVAFDTNAKGEKGKGATTLTQPRVREGDGLSNGWLDNMKLVGQNEARELAGRAFTLLWIDLTVPVKDILKLLQDVQSSTVVCFHGWIDGDLPDELREHLSSGR